MRHLLMDPAFPDLVANWAASPSSGEDGPANDNGEEPENDLNDRICKMGPPDEPDFHFCG